MRAGNLKWNRVILPEVTIGDSSDTCQKHSDNCSGAPERSANSVAALKFSGPTQADVNAFVAAQRAETTVMRRGLASRSFGGGQSVQSERQADDHAVGTTITKLRADLGLMPGTCSFLMA